MSGLAHYKLAWVRVNQTAVATPSKSFESAIQASHRWIHSADKRSKQNARQIQEPSIEGTRFDVRREALVDLAFCYSKERPDKRSEALGVSSRMIEARSSLLLRKVGRRYVILERNEGLRDVSRALRPRSDSSRRREDAENLHSAIKGLKTTSTSVMMSDVSPRHLLEQFALQGSPRPSALGS